MGDTVPTVCCLQLMHMGPTPQLYNQQAALDDSTMVTWCGATRGLLTVPRPAACIAAHRRQVAILAESRQPCLRALLDSARRQTSICC